MYRSLKSALASAVIVAAFTTAVPAAEVVKVTPLGGQEGEFCRLDRALIFEDPTGTRLLYDAGRTVAGPDDPRLGKIDVVLVSHMHGDHAGNRHTKAPGAGTCAMPDFSVDATPNTNSANIAAKTGAKIVTGSEMAKFFAAKMKEAGGNPKDSLLVRFGASRTIGGVKITTVPAVHSNGIDPSFLAGPSPLADQMKAAGITAYAGPPTGYVLNFSNGLVVYLSGDTGITAEQDLVVRQHYGAKLMVINIGDTFTTGPVEAAYVANRLVQPATVIASHANEEATKGGKVIEGTRTAKFIEMAKMPVHVPLSGKTMSFDANAKCTEGC
jgi:L-ascorbate metabolism protein UlaG (beta-lactamase superfamily)